MNKVMIKNRLEAEIYGRTSGKPLSRTKISLKPFNPQFRGEILLMICIRFGITKVGIHTPPIAARMTTDTAPNMLAC